MTNDPWKHWYKQRRYSIPDWQDEDPLRPARGILLACAIGLAMWVIGGLIVWRLLP